MFIREDEQLPHCVCQPHLSFAETKAFALILLLSAACGGELYLIGIQSCVFNLSSLLTMTLQNDMQTMSFYIYGPLSKHKAYLAYLTQSCVQYPKEI